MASTRRGAVGGSGRPTLRRSATSEATGRHPGKHRPVAAASALLTMVTLTLALLSSPSPASAATTGPDYGSVFAWGRNNVHQTDVPSPANGGGITHISAAGHLAMALTWDGKVVAWGDNTYGQANVPAGLSNVVAIASGGTFAVALRSNGSVAVWGNSSYHVTNVPAAAQSGVVGIAAGASFVVALKSDGSIFGWGNNSMGALNIPQVNGVPLTNLKAVSSSGQVLGLKADGKVAAWGLNDYGQTNVPGYLAGARSIAAGLRFSLALDANGGVTGWGDNTDHELTPPCTLYNVISKACVQVMSGFSAIAAGDKHSVAIKTGRLYAWGNNAYGQATIPDTRPNGPDGFVEVAAGSDFSIALWGRPSPPGPPAAVEATAGNASAALNWAGMAPHGAAITSCTITAYPGGKTYVASAAIDGYGWSHATISGLTNGTTYTFTVRGTNGLGTGPESAHTNSVTPQLTKAFSLSFAPPAGSSFNLLPSLSLSSLAPITQATSGPTGASSSALVAEASASAGTSGPIDAGSPAAANSAEPSSAGPSPSGSPGSPGNPEGGEGGVPTIVLIGVGALIVAGGVATGMYLRRRTL